MSENEDQILEESQSVDTSKKDTQEKKPKEKKPDESITFSKEENDVFTQVEQELNIDETDHTDLEEGLPELPSLTSEQLQDIIKDPNTRAKLREETDNPNIYDTLKQTDDIQKMSKEELTKLRKDLVEEKQNLMVYLGSQPTIKLHLRMGMVDGKNVWAEKEFPFNSLDKRQEFHLNVLRARLNTLNVKYNIVGAKTPLQLTDPEINFLSKGSIMIEVAGYRLGEKEALLKVGMSPEDYARVDVDEYKIAQLAWAWRSQNVPYYKQRR